MLPVEAPGGLTPGRHLLEGALSRRLKGVLGYGPEREEADGGVAQEQEGVEVVGAASETPVQAGLLAVPRRGLHDAEC
ncbi:hypothetical protein GCM10020216_025200 [Nonomuraea helvata]